MKEEDEFQTEDEALFSAVKEWANSKENSIPDDVYSEKKKEDQEGDLDHDDDDKKKAKKAKKEKKKKLKKKVEKKKLKDESKTKSSSKAERKQRSNNENNEDIKSKSPKKNAIVHHNNNTPPPHFQTNNSPLPTRITHSTSATTHHSPPSNNNSHKFSLHVTNIPYDATKQQIIMAFTNHGCQVTSTRLVYNYHKRSFPNYNDKKTNVSMSSNGFTGVAFVDFADKNSYQNGLTLDKSFWSKAASSNNDKQSTRDHNSKKGDNRRINVRPTRTKQELANIVKLTQEKIAEKKMIQKQKYRDSTASTHHDYEHQHDSDHKNEKGKKRTFSQHQELKNEEESKSLSSSITAPYECTNHEDGKNKNKIESNNEKKQSSTKKKKKKDKKRKTVEDDEQKMTKKERAKKAAIIMSKRRKSN